MIYSIFHPLKIIQFDLVHSGDGGGVILKEPTIRIETFHHKMKVVLQKKSIFICTDPSLQGDKWTQTISATC